MIDTLQRAITVADLRAMLEFMDPESPVLFVCDYGNHSHTQQALPVIDAYEADTGDLVQSAYSLSGLALAEDDRRYEPQSDDIMPVVILRSGR